MASIDFILKQNEESDSKFYRICCAPGCRSNFTADEKPVQTFSFPKDKILRKKWLSAIKADKKYKLIAPQICVKHFEEHFLQRQVAIQNIGHETRIYPNAKIQLVDDAIPTVFFNEQSLHFNNKKQSLFFGKRDIEYTYSKIEKTENFCRICLASNIRLTSLATVRKISASTLEVENNECGKLFEYLFPLKTSDLPKWLKICFLCQNQIEIFFKFRKQALQIHRNLMAISKSVILMDALSKSSQERYLINQQNLNSDFYDDSSVIENEWNETTASAFEDQYICDNKNKKSSKISNLSNLNEKIVEELDTDFSSSNFNCPICSEKYSTQKELDFHIINHKKQENNESLQTSNKIVYVCEYCSKEFFNQEILFNHRKEHYGKFENFVIKCSNCKETFNDRNHFYRHKILCNKKNQKYFKCRYCLKRIFKYKAFKNHLKMHKISQNTNISIYNVKINSNNDNAVMNKNKVSSEDVKQCDDKDLRQSRSVKCQLCNVIYETKKLFQLHLYQDHLIDYKFRCPYSTCQISFLNEIYLKNHIMDHRNPEKQKFLNDINEQILESKITLEKISFNITKNDQAIISSKFDIPKLIDEREYTKNNYLKNEFIDEYEIVLQELNSSCTSKDINENSHNYVELKNKEDFEYFKEKDTRAAKNGNVNLIYYNQDEDRMFEIDIKPEFY